MPDVQILNESSSTSLLCAKDKLKLPKRQIVQLRNKIQFSRLTTKLHTGPYLAQRASSEVVLSSCESVALVVVVVVFKKLFLNLKMLVINLKFQDVNILFQYVNLSK